MGKLVSVGPTDTTSNKMWFFKKLSKHFPHNTCHVQSAPHLGLLTALTGNAAELPPCVTVHTQVARQCVCAMCQRYKNRPQNMIRNDVRFTDNKTKDIILPECLFDLVLDNRSKKKKTLFTSSPLCVYVCVCKQTRMFL